MPSVFTLIIRGELPARFVWSDAVCVAFLSINPVNDGHTLVVPRVEIDHWIDLDDDIQGHLQVVAAHIGRAMHGIFGRARVAAAIAGFEVPHTHLHVFPANSMAEIDFARAAVNPDPARLDTNAAAIREALRDAGHGDHVPDA
jgi:diadenosine tetraphosphate (Ap4A) HIT family hydrolase